MKVQCNFIGWATEGVSLKYKGIDLMQELDFATLIKDRKKYFGIYPSNIPKPENIGKKIELIPVKYDELDCLIAYTEFSTCYYLFYVVENDN